MATTMATTGDRVARVTLAIPRQPNAPAAQAVLRLTIGVLFIWVFFENLGKGLYTPRGYAGAALSRRRGLLESIFRRR